MNDRAGDMEAAHRHTATIVTFASSMSGVGRTGAIANVAVLLAAAGLRVLVVDWTGESMSVHAYLAPFHAGESTTAGGLVARFGRTAAAESDPVWRPAPDPGWPPVVTGGAAGPATGARLGAGGGTGGVGFWRTKRYRLPEHMGVIDLVERRDDAAGPAAILRPARSAGLREMLRTSGYDYVLVDGPTDPPAAACRIIGAVSDVVVVPFLMGGLAVSAAAVLVHRIRSGAENGVRIIPVPAQVDAAAADELVRGRQHIREAFAGLLPAAFPAGATASGADPDGGGDDGADGGADGRADDGADGGAAGGAEDDPADRADDPADGADDPADGAAAPLEIPRRQYGVAEGILATMADDPAVPDTLLRAYERLTGEITRGAVSSLVPPSPQTRQRYRRVCGLDPVPAPETMSLAYAVPDRPWADWIRAQLERTGVRVKMPATDGAATGTLLVVLSPHLRSSPQAAWLRTPPAAGPPGREVVAVRVAAESAADPEPPAAVREITLVGADEVAARGALLRHFALIPAATPPRPRRGFTPRYPAAGPERTVVENLPAAPVEFAGRDTELERLRERLLSAAGAAVLAGPGGTGKSELARRYALRFATDYDVVWWLPAHDPARVRAGLAELAGRLSVPPAGDAVAAVLAHLAAGADDRSWLLIYDDAGDPAALDGLLAEGEGGHVIITTRTPAAGAEPPALTLGPLTIDEAAEYLTRSVARLGPDRARKIAMSVDGRPFALGLAAAWLRETTAWLRAQGALGVEASTGWAAAEFLARLEQHQDTDPDAACLAVTSDSLRHTETGRLTLRLLELCAWLSPDGIGQALLCSRPMAEQLVHAAGDDGAAIMEDSWLLHQVFWTAARFGLADIDRRGKPSLRVHRVLQEMVRDSLAPGLRTRRHGQTLAALAGCVPIEADNSIGEHQEIYAELQRHLLPSGAPADMDPEVRRWLVNQIRYLYNTGDRGVHVPALRLAEELLARWRTAVEPDDLLLNRLLGQIANLRRALGDFRGALAASDEALAAQRAAQGAAHFRALITARGRAADLHGRGLFRAALAENQAVHDAFAEAFGDDHPETVLSRLNLATSLFLMGSHKAAFAAADDARRRIARGSYPGGWFGLVAERIVADLRRELGDPEGARRALVDVLRKVRALPARRAGDELRVLRSLAATERRLGDLEAAYRRDLEVRDGFRALLGPGHPDTVAVRLSIAADRDAAGDHVAAAEDAERCLGAFGRAYDEAHPFTQLCKADLAVFLLNAGDAGRSAELADAAWTSLRESLGERHPWALVTGVGYTRSLVAVGELQRALEIDEATADDCLELLGGEHPCTRLAADALADSRRRLAAGGVVAGAAHRPALHLDVPSP